MANLKELTHREDRLAGGHRLCAGCGASIARAAGAARRRRRRRIVVGCATGCLEVSTTIYPYSSWKVPFIHNAFENSAATVSGVEAAFKGLQRAGKIPADKKMKFVAFGGDGGTYDIGLQSLSGAMERGHDMVYVCYDNGAYMNTGIQRSSATPMGAWATTAEVGAAQQGKQQRRKDLTAIMAAHDIPYVAQASISHWKDLTDEGREGVRGRRPRLHQRLRAVPARLAHPVQQVGRDREARRADRLLAAVRGRGRRVADHDEGRTTRSRSRSSSSRRAASSTCSSRATRSCSRGSRREVDRDVRARARRAAARRRSTRRAIAERSRARSSPGLFAMLESGVSRPIGRVGQLRTHRRAASRGRRCSSLVVAARGVRARPTRTAGLRRDVERRHAPARLGLGDVPARCCGSSPATTPDKSTRVRLPARSALRRRHQGRRARGPRDRRRLARPRRRRRPRSGCSSRCCRTTASSSPCNRRSASTGLTTAAGARHLRGQDHELEAARRAGPADQRARPQRGRVGEDHPAQVRARPLGNAGASRSRPTRSSSTTSPTWSRRSRRRRARSATSRSATDSRRTSRSTT